MMPIAAALRGRVAQLRAARDDAGEVGPPECDGRGRRARPGEITRASSLSLEDDLDDIARTVDAWEAAGFDYLVCGWPTGGRAQIEPFASRFLTV